MQPRKTIAIFQFKGTLHCSTAQAFSRLEAAMHRVVWVQTCAGPLRCLVADPEPPGVRALGLPGAAGRAEQMMLPGPPDDPTSRVPPPCVPAMQNHVRASRRGGVA